MFDPIQNKKDKQQQVHRSEPIIIPERKDNVAVVQQLEMLEDIICHQFKSLNNKIK